jgi:hypothetical protein
MAFYTNNVVTEIYNSVFDQSKYRSEFRLTPDKLYLSNMRILNLGLTATEVGDKRYNLVNGAGSVIKNIYLYDGSVILDKIINYGDFSAFQEYNHTNQYNSDIGKVLHRAGLGFVYEKEPNPLNGEANAITIKETFPNCPTTPRATQEVSAMGYLNLNTLFPLLKAGSGLQFLHTGLFKNLRVVIEYNVVGAAVGTGVSVGINTTLPILVADCVEDPKVAEKFLSEFKGQSWISNEVESVVVPIPKDKDGNIIVGTQEVKYRLTGALGKTVNYMLVQKKGTTELSALYGSHSSESQIDEAVQIYCNGSAILPESGVTTPSQRLAMLHDTFSTLNTHTCAASLPMFDDQEYVEEYGDRIGRLDYFGCIVNKKVQALDLLYSRLISTNVAVEARYRQALTLNVFYGIVKQIVKDGKGGYNVMYV